MKRRPVVALAEAKGLLAAVCAAAALVSSAAEAPYAFRARLECVHGRDLRDSSARPAADEFAFRDGAVVAVANDACEELFAAAEDFVDYLGVSMGVRARAARGGVGTVAVELDPALRDREYTVDVGDGSVGIRARDPRAAAQALYHLEDLMNLRRAPFLRIGSERRRMRFSPRMVHSGYACDVFPDAYLKLIAHHGFDAIVFYIKDVDRTAAGPNQDVNGMIERARRVGLDVYLYSSVSCFAHPDDPEGAKEIEACFGRIAKAHPGAKGMVFVGESCQFPSRDPRVQPVRHRDINHDDPRPLAGWFPCRDYPDWLRAVMKALHEHSPGMEIVFWTYNWSRQDSRCCAELIPHFPDGVAIQGTLGNGAVTRHDNGLVCTCRDYTVSTPGFTEHYAAQARAAKSANRRFYTMANTAGLTWDYGVAPYLPCPHQWKKRWDGLVDPQYGIAGLMETHHFGWYPSFISELAKEAYTEGGMAFDDHLRKIAARDFGEENADRVVEAWRQWSRTEVDYVANNENQYGPFRIGPAFPYNFGGGKIRHADFPQDRKAYHTMRWMAILNFPFDLEQAREQNVAFAELDDDYRLKQLELFERMRACFASGVKTLKDAAETLDGARRAKAEEMVGVGEWHQRTVETAINLNRGFLAFKRGDRAETLKYARAEYANAKAALKLVEKDSRLGWEPSMEYAAGPEQIRWKLGLMESLYGDELK